ncbi:hypothetical protein CR513_26958, partial [Mucuna pruriens]
MPHFVGVRDGKYRMRWSVKRRASIWKAAISELIATVLAESKLGATYNIKVWTSRDHVGFKSSQLSVIGTKILGTTIPSTTTSANATVGEQSHNGGLDFTISTKHNYDHT